MSRFYPWIRYFSRKECIEYLIRKGLTLQDISQFYSIERITWDDIKKWQVWEPGYYIYSRKKKSLLKWK